MVRTFCLSRSAMLYVSAVPMRDRRKHLRSRKPTLSVDVVSDYLGLCLILLVAEYWLDVYRRRESSDFRTVVGSIKYQPKRFR